ncbi:MAG: hypothetical protein H0V33_01590, partial [Acidimicrobiia bacterium]|nr:hypothetical protein [Acidimicrobiia bacterium]
LGVILAFVGVKMLLIGEPFEVHLPTWSSLAVITVVMTVAIVASIRAAKRDRAAGILPPDNKTDIVDAADADAPGGVDPDRDLTGRGPQA